MESATERAQVSALRAQAAKGGTGTIETINSLAYSTPVAAPTAQVTPQTLTDFLFAQLPVQRTGLFLYTVTFGYTAAANTDTYQFEVRHLPPQATTFVPANATSIGVNTWQATASGPITYPGAPAETLMVETGAIESITGELVNQVTLTGALNLGADGQFVGIAVAVLAGGAYNFTPIANSVSITMNEVGVG